jgi:hypothetical protein
MGATRTNIPLAGNRPQTGMRPQPNESGDRGPSQPSREVRPTTDRPGIKFGPGTSRRAI